MKTISAQLKSWEHCPDCGALLVTVPGAGLCPHCGYEGQDPEEKSDAELSRLSGRRGEGMRFVLMDYQSEPAWGRAA